jgi:hypothetical protein
MAIINGTATGETLTRTLAANIITDLGGNDQQFGDGECALRDGGHDNIDGGAGNNNDNEGEVAGRQAIGAVPLFNVFRPF